MKDAEIDAIYDLVYDSFHDGRFGDVEDLLADMEPITMTTTELVTWLTVTSPARGQLPSRTKLLEQLQKTTDESTWRGLA